MCIRDRYKPVQQKKRQYRRNARSHLNGDVPDQETSSMSESSQKTKKEQHLEDDNDTSQANRKPRKHRSHDDSNISEDYTLKGENDDLDPLTQETSNPTGEGNDDEEAKKLQDRKRATLVEREEKQYQWMLEKALKESRRISNPEENNPEDHGVTQSNDAEGAKVNLGEQSNDVSQRTNSEQPIPSNKIIGKESNSKEEEEKQSSKESISPSASTTTISSLEEKPTHTFSKPRKSSRITKPGRRGPYRNNRNKTANDNKTQNDIDITKPVKPRLPPQRTSLNEMRRRVAAILEFISRTQWELSQDQKGRDYLVEFVENQEYISKIDSIFQNYNTSLALMDDLTRQLLLWEKKYATSSPQS